jgi:hypothetical protein
LLVRDLSHAISKPERAGEAADLALLTHLRGRAGGKQLEVDNHLLAKPAIETSREEQPMPSPEKPVSKGAKSKKVPSPDAGHINLSAPWEDSQYGNANVMSGVALAEPDGTPIATRFVEQRSKVHETYIKEHNRTKRLGLVISAVLVVASCCVVLFAPAGRETASYIIGAVLVVIAAGVAGFTAIKLKVPGFRLDASNKR